MPKVQVKIQKITVFEYILFQIDFFIVTQHFGIDTRWLGKKLFIFLNASVFNFLRLNLLG